MNHQKLTINMEFIISLVLQIGVMISAIIILIGISLLLHLNHGSYQEFTSTNYSFPHSLSTLISSIKVSQGTGYIELGVLILILTPVLRVATSILLFLRQRDMPMTVVTCFVLVVLISSFILGMAIN